MYDDGWLFYRRHRGVPATEFFGGPSQGAAEAPEAGALSLTSTCLSTSTHGSSLSGCAVCRWRKLLRSAMVCSCVWIVRGSETALLRRYASHPYDSAFLTPPHSLYHYGGMGNTHICTAGGSASGDCIERLLGATARAAGEHRRAA